jgi:hypothetical protein
MSARILTAALAYAGRGLAVFPARPDKKCSYKSAEYSDGRKWGMTRDPVEIRRDFARWPDCRIGVPTGAVNGIVVVDVDTIEGHGIDGSIALRELEAKHGSLPQTLQAISPTGSIHHYLKHPGDGIKIKGSASELGAGIDIRGDGNMTVAPPSLNPDGRCYRWIHKCPIAPMPAWLIELTREKPPSISQRAVARISRPRDCFNIYVRTPRAAPGAYGAAALRNEIANIHRAEPGHRNAVLMLAETEVAGLLFQAAAAWGNPNKDRNVIRYAPCRPACGSRDRGVRGHDRALSLPRRCRRRIRAQGRRRDSAPYHRGADRRRQNGDRRRDRQARRRQVPTSFVPGAS